jgi:hypothetical protein
LTIAPSTRPFIDNNCNVQLVVYSEVLKRAEPL